MRNKRMGLILAALLILVEATAAQEGQDKLRELVETARAQQSSGSYNDAIATLGTALEVIAQRSNAEIQAAFVHNELSVLHRTNGNRTEALAAAQASVEILNELAPLSGLQAVALLNLGLALVELEDLEAAITIFEQSAQAAIAAGDGNVVGLASVSGASALVEIGAYSQAVNQLEKITKEDALAPDLRARAARILANAYLALRQPEEARATVDSLPIPDRDIILEAMLEIQLGQAHLAEDRLLAASSTQQRGNEAAQTSYLLSEIAFQRGRYPEADELNTLAFDQAIETTRAGAVLKAQAIHRRSLILQKVGDLPGSLETSEEAEAQLAAVLGSNHPLTWQLRLERTRTLSALGMHEEAIRLAELVWNDSGFNSSDFGAFAVLAQAALGFAYFEAGFDVEAVRAFKAIRTARAERQFSRVDEPPGLIALGQLLHRRGDNAEAEEAALEALSILSGSGLSDSIDLAGEARALLAAIRLERGQTDEADALIDENIEIITQRLARLGRVSSYTSDFTPDELRKQVEQALDRYVGHEDANQYFETLQLVHLNEVAKATNGFVRYSGHEDDEVSSLLSELERTEDELQALTGLKLEDGSDIGQRILALRSRLDEINTRLSVEAQDVFDELTLQPTELHKLQSVLRDDEAFWVHFSGNQGTFLALITRSKISVARSDFTEEELVGVVSQLRETLDQRDGSALMPFDFDSASILYEELIQPFAIELESIEKIVLMPDGAARQLSFAALGSKSINGDQFDFLGLEKSLVVAPSVASFVAQRTSDSPRSSDGFVGFGDPVFGNPERDSSVRAIAPSEGVSRAISFGQSFGALPETRRELEVVSSKTPESERKLFLGSDANEVAFRRLDGERFGTLVFATHAVVSGDFDFLSEPALVLTPGDVNDPSSDGLLTASEISRLQIDANLVVLSACNTGAPSGRYGASGLSGLARGFLDAGAKSLVVSHWNINSASSLAIMPKFFENMGEDREFEPSRAMLDAMRFVAVDLAKAAENESFSHPAIWAPFMIVGAQ